MSDSIPYTAIIGRIKDDIDFIAEQAYVAGYERGKKDVEQKRKKGKWVYDGKGFYTCSSCGKHWVHWWARVVPLDRMSKELRYCPMCGADMRGDEE